MITSDSELKKKTQQVRKNMQPMFLQNAGITGMVFNERHPYFDVPEQYRELALNNFNLPIPEND
jgi:hypothetical protein